MSNLSIYRNTFPSLLTSNVFDDVFAGVFSDWDNAYKRTTQGYPVVDITKQKDGTVVMEFALAGWRKSDLDINIQPEKNTITVSGAVLEDNENGETRRRIARRNFCKSYVNYDSNLDLTKTTAKYEDGLLTVTVPQRPETQPVTVEIL